MRKIQSLYALLTLCAFQAPAGAAVVYDGLNAGTIATFTGSTPRTYMGQAFSVADPGGPVEITSMRIVTVAGGVFSTPASRLRIQFWDTFDPAAAGATLAFSASAPIQIIDTGAINVAGGTAFTFTVNFATPITLTGLTNHGIVVNWQSDPLADGNFVDNTLLTMALRTGTGGAIPPPALTQGANLNPGGGYFRNASGLTTMNLQAGDARTIANVGGLMFELSTIPEPGSMAMLGIALCGTLSRRRR